MDPMTALAIGTTVASGIGSYLGGKKTADTSRQNTLRTIEARKELADKEFANRKEMWNAMKEYNTPASQMKRFKKAGLNKNLIYGQGTPGNVSSFPRYSAPDVDYRQIKPDLSTSSAIKRLGEFQGDIMKSRKITGQELANIGQSWTNTVKNVQAMNAERKNYLDSLLHGAIQKSPTDRITQYLVDNWAAEMTSQEKKNYGQALRNEYQKEVNQLIKKGLTPGDSVRIRIGLKILEALNVDTSGILQSIDNN